MRLLLCYLLAFSMLTARAENATLTYIHPSPCCLVAGLNGSVLNVGIQLSYVAGVRSVRFNRWLPQPKLGERGKGTDGLPFVDEGHSGVRATEFGRRAPPAGSCLSGVAMHN
jgi:hypothetical protein